MQKKIIATLFVMVTVAAVVVSSAINKSKNDCTTFEANVEALTQSEETGGGSAKVWDCWSQFQSYPGVSSTKCGNPCSDVEGKMGIGEPSKCYAN